MDVTAAVKREVPGGAVRGRDAGFREERLGEGRGEVDGEGDVVGEVGVSGVGAELNTVDVGSPVLGEEDVVDVVAAVLVMPKIVGRAGLAALKLGKEVMVGAGEAVFFQ